MLKFRILILCYLFPLFVIAQKRNMTYLALGDSYTIGESVEENERWPVVLANRLKSEGKTIQSPKIIARTGWTTDELKAAILKENISDTFDMVSLLIGVNNQYRGRDVEQFRHEFVELLEMAISFAGKDKSKVFVVSIPDWGVMPFAEGRNRELIAQQIDRYNAVKKEETQKKGIRFIDITPISRQAKTDKSLVADDDLHPSAKMYALWVEKIIPEILK